MGCWALGACAGSTDAADLRAHSETSSSARHLPLPSFYPYSSPLGQNGAGAGAGPPLAFKGLRCKSERAFLPKPTLGNLTPYQGAWLGQQHKLDVSPHSPPWPVPTTGHHDHTGAHAVPSSLLCYFPVFQRTPSPSCQTACSPPLPELLDTV